MGRLKTLQPRVTNKLPTRLATAPSADSWRSGKTSTERGYGYKWQKAREHFLRQHPVCVRCQAEGRAELATVVDHRIPHRGDQQLFWDEGNWDALCVHHHSSAKQAEEKANFRDR